MLITRSLVFFSHTCYYWLFFFAMFLSWLLPFWTSTTRWRLLQRWVGLGLERQVHPSTAISLPWNYNNNVESHSSIHLWFIYDSSRIHRIIVEFFLKKLLHLLALTVMLCRNVSVSCLQFSIGNSFNSVTNLTKKQHRFPKFFSKPFANICQWHKLSWWYQCQPRRRNGNIETSKTRKIWLLLDGH